MVLVQQVVVVKLMRWVVEVLVCGMCGWIPQALMRYET